MDKDRTISDAEILKFRQDYLALNRDIDSALSQPENERHVVQDGVFNYEGYLKSKIKVLWIMKEPYDETNGKGGGWHFSDTKVYKALEFGRSSTTWHPIIYASYGILNDFLPFEKMGRISKHNKDVAKVLSHIGYINIQKLPSLTREKSKYSVLYEAFQSTKHLFDLQMNLLQPDVIICASTMPIIFQHLGLKGNLHKEYTTCTSYVAHGRVYINAKHPAQRKGRSGYVNDIVSAVREYKNSQVPN